MDARLGRPVIEPVGESRSNADVFGELLELTRTARGVGSARRARRDARRPRPPAGDDRRDQVREHGAAIATVRRPAHPVRRRVAAHAGSEGRSVSGGARAPRRTRGCTSISRIRRRREFPLALISPASDKTISSTLAEIPRPEVRLLMHPDDAAERGIADGDEIRIFNALGEVRCHGSARRLDPPRHVSRCRRASGASTRERLHGHVARAGLADRHRRRRVLQRRARASRAKS